MTTDMIKAELPATFHKTWQGQEFQFNTGDMHPTWIARIFDYGLRVVNDAANSAGKDMLTSDKVEFIYDMVAEINAGEAWEGRSRGGSAAMSPVDARALKLAKEALKVGFRAVTGKARIVDMVAASDRVAEYFDGTTWVDARVMEWLEAQDTDYRALAEKQLADEKALAASIDF